MKSNAQEAATPQTEPAAPSVNVASQLGQPNAPPVSRRRATLVNLFFQYATVAIMIVRGIVLAPLYLVYLGEELTGAWMASGDVLAWITVAEGGIGTVIRQLVAECSGRRDTQSLREVIGSGAVMLLIAAGVIACAGLALTPWLPALLEVEGADARELSRAFLLAIAATAIMILSSTARSTLQGMQLHAGQGVAWIAAESVNIVATIALLVTGWGVVSIGLGMLISQVVSNLMLWSSLVVALRLPPRDKRECDWRPWWQRVTLGACGAVQPPWKSPASR